jgi:hypothetical protein
MDIEALRALLDRTMSTARQRVPADVPTPVVVPTPAPAAPPTPETFAERLGRLDLDQLAQVVAESAGIGRCPPSGTK